MSSILDRVLLDENPDALIILKPSGHVIYWNKSAETIFGYSSDEAIGRDIEALIVPSARAAEHGAFIARAARVGSASFESLRLTKNGVQVYVDVSVKAVRGERGEIDYFLLAQKDVTALKVARDARLIEARFRGLLESMPDGIVVASQSGHIVVASSQAERLFGYERGELRGLLVETLLPQQLRKTHVSHRASYSAQPRARSMGAAMDLRGLRKDGSEFPVEISLSPLLTDEGSFVLSAVRDISERQKAEQRFRALLEAAPDAIVIVDSNGEIQLVNSQTETLFGYARAELLGKKVEMLMPERFRQMHPAHREGFFVDAKFRAMGAGLELLGLRRDGTEFPVEISLSPLESHDGRLVISAIRDVTERKRYERALSDKNVELMSVADTKNRFLANMSHELRTPLNAVIGFTGTLLMQLPGPLTAAQEKQLKTIRSSAQHLLSLINDLLDVTRIESGKVELNIAPVSCLGVVQDVFATLLPSAEKKHLNFQLRTPADDVFVDTDRRALTQIIINLTNNAIKYTSAGDVILGLDTRSQGNSAAVEFVVSDTGCGIRAEDHAKLFQAFTQIDSSSARSHEGTGLGLHVSQKLAALLGARITFASEIGAGSIFTLSFIKG